jgi:hypothetical protein
MKMAMLSTQKQQYPATQGMASAAAATCQTAQNARTRAGQEPVTAELAQVSGATASSQEHHTQLLNNRN